MQEAGVDSGMSRENPNILNGYNSFISYYKVHILLSEIENIIPDAIFRKTGGPSDYNRESIISILYAEIILNSNDNLDFFIALHDKCPRNLYIMNFFKTMY